MDTVNYYNNIIHNDSTQIITITNKIEDITNSMRKTNSL